jgi:hypothetical protein
MYVIRALIILVLVALLCLKFGYVYIEPLLAYMQESDGFWLVYFGFNIGLITLLVIVYLIVEGLKVGYANKFKRS